LPEFVSGTGKKKRRENREKMFYEREFGMKVTETRNEDPARNSGS